MACEQHNIKSECKVKYINICRICLEPGEIPIFGGEGKPDLSSDISAFGAIKVCQNDEMPQNICYSCYALLQNAILFRDLAKKSARTIDYQKTLIEGENLCIKEENTNNIIRNNREHYSDHRYLKTEVFDTEEQFCNSRHDSNSEIVPMKKSKYTKSKNNIVSSTSEKNSEKLSTITSCKICNINFGKPVDYYEHELTTAHIYNVKNMGRIQCDICQSTMNRSYYLRHLLHHSSGVTSLGRNRHMCKICNKMLFSNEDLKEHRNSEEHKTVSNTSNIECPVCHVTVKRIELKKHLSRHASEVANRVKQKCPLCNKIMSYSYYTTHLKRKHNIDIGIRTIEVSPTRTTEENKIKIETNCEKKTINEGNLSVNKKDSAKEIKDTGENCNDHDLDEDHTTETPEPSFNESSSLNRGSRLNSVNTQIRAGNSKIDGNISDMTKLADCSTEDIEKKKKDITVVNSVHFCDICFLKFPTSDKYYEHLRTSNHIDNLKNYGKIECNICKKTINKSYYVNHLKYHCFQPIQIDGVYTCKICNEKLSGYDVRKHINSEEHKASERSASEIECPICHTIVDVVSLTTHLQHHASEKSIGLKQQCSICKKFISLRYYQKHLKEIHNICDNIDKNIHTESKIKSYVCEVCGKVFKKSFLFRAHCLTHGQEKNFKCDMCPYRGLTKSLLKTHLKAHLGIYKYKCDLCPELKFLSKSNLNKHVRTHRGPIDFICEICSKGFYNKGDLRNHIDAVHFGIKRHVCHICNNAFAYVKGLRRHMLDIHKQNSNSGRVRYIK